MRVGPRILALALLVATSPADTDFAVRWGPYVAVAVWLTGDPGRFRTDRVFWVTVLMTGWTGLTTLWAINSIAPQMFIYTISLAVTLLLARDAMKTLQQVRVVAYGYLLGLFYAVAQTVAGAYGLIEAAPNVTGAIVRYSVGDVNANYLGYALVGGLAVVMFLWVTGESRRNRFWLAVIAASILVGMQLTGTRGALLGAALLAAWLIICRLVKRPPVLLLSVGVTAAALLIATGLIDTLVRSLDTGQRATGDLSGRLVVWPLARDLWGESWFVGSGPRAMREMNTFGIDAHNAILELGSAQGIIGVALFITFLIVLLWWGNRDADRRLRAVVIGGFLAASAPSYLTGAWEATAAAWMLLIIFSRVGAPSWVEPRPGEDVTMSAQGIRYRTPSPAARRP